MEIPYIFEPKTKARANEVNENFRVIYNQVDSNTTEINRNFTEISNLENNKADLNGSTTNTFKVRNPVAPEDAVNLYTFKKMIGNSINIIGGLKIYKDSTATTENTIIIKSGKCYDKTKNYVLSLQEDITLTKSGLTVNATYDVYIQSIDDGTTSTIEIYPHGNEPSEVIIYRLIGYIVINSDGEIAGVSSLGTDDNCSELSKIEPDYETGIISGSVSTTVSWIAPCNGWITAAATNTTWRIDGNVPYRLDTFVPAGSRLTGTSSTAYSFNFLPCKG